MELPEKLRVEIEARAADEPLGALVQAARDLSQSYRQQVGEGRRLATTKRQALAYAVSRMPATYSALWRSLSLALDCYGGDIRSVLDVGAGTGAGIWAAWAQLREGVRYFCLEREPAMIALGRDLAQCQPELAEAEWLCADAAEGPGDCRADLVLAGYMLGEMTGPQREQAVQALWGATQGMLLLVEPGTPIGFAQLRSAREQLLAMGAQMAAPCPHGDRCPMEEDWCHFSVRVSRSRLHKLCKGGDAPFEDEKFAFLAVCRQQGKPAAARILRHPNIQAGHIGLNLCTQEGICQRVVGKKQKQAFKAARKADAGDAFAAPAGAAHGLNGRI